jgi:hypothetical protein
MSITWLRISRERPYRNESRRPLVCKSKRPLPRAAAFSICNCGQGLVDLERFELSTSSMPFKKYQSLADSFVQNKRLSKRRGGLRWTPRGGFWASGLHADSRTPRWDWHVACFPARAVAGCSICCLPKETTIGFHIKDDAHVEMQRRHSYRCGENEAVVWRGSVSFTAPPLSASHPHRPVAPGSAA